MKKVPVTQDESNFYIHQGENDKEGSETPAIMNALLDGDATNLSKIEAFGKLKYSKERILAVLDLTKTERKIFLEHFEDPTSDERVAYERGLVMGDAEIDIGLTNAARDGDSFSAKELWYRQDQRRVDELKKELFNI
jgi:hypothetical protein